MPGLQRRRMNGGGILIDAMQPAVTGPIDRCVNQPLTKTADL
jgi:hypothetical protein